MRKILIILCAMFIGTAYACDTNQIDVLGDGTQCETVKFTITTTELEPDTEFKFYMSASGTFYVDCGVDGVLDGTGASNKTITRSDTTSAIYTCTYSAGGAKTIRFGGTATGYSTNTETATIRFYVGGGQSETNAVKIASISGNLSAIFPWFSGNTADGAAPRFVLAFYHATNLTSIPDTLFANYTIGTMRMFEYTFQYCRGLTSIPAGLFSGITTGANLLFHSTFFDTGLTSIPTTLFSSTFKNINGTSGMFQETFRSCTRLTSIPETLFSGITTSTYRMFYYTFQNCTSLTSIPAGLFSGITKGATEMFADTFYGCTGLTLIPAGLFSGITTGADFMFYATFYGCTGLTSIPAGLFSGITKGADSLFYATFYNCTGLTSIPAGLFSGITTGAAQMFYQTFQSCTKLTSIPAGLFSGITKGANSMFRSTFNRCTGLTSIPADLFSGITTGADNMFAYTFYLCTGLTSIPADLFSGIKTGASNMFYYTFSGCSNLSGYIPPSTFAGLIAKGSPTATDMWYLTFSGTKVATSCPAGTVQYMTGYEGTGSTTWDGRVSCVDENLVCGAGEYLPAHWFQCETCPENNYCVGGTYPYSETVPSGITQCASELYSPSGMWESAQCGRILHIGDQIVYLRSVKKTSPALHIDIDNDGVADFFGNMTTLDVVMNANTDKKLKLQYGGQTYSVYDDSVAVGE